MSAQQRSSAGESMIMRKPLRLEPYRLRWLAVLDGAPGRPRRRGLPGFGAGILHRLKRVADLHRSGPHPFPRLIVEIKQRKVPGHRRLAETSRVRDLRDGPAFAVTKLTERLGFLHRAQVLPLAVFDQHHHRGVRLVGSGAADVDRYRLQARKFRCGKPPVAGEQHELAVTAGLGE
jgi:hypothetical protein